MKVIMTMAGLGARFKDAGYTQEKYEIVFHGKPLFDWALESLSAFRDFEFIFIARDSPHVKEFILERTDLLGFRKIKIKTLTHLTRGQAETAALASEFFEPDDSMIIYNTDTHVKPGTLRPEQIKGNGWVPVFSASGDKWSFVEADVDGTVKRTTEKVRVSDYCSIGLYYFDSFQKFWKLVGDLQAGNSNKAKEWYIAPLYNEFIRLGNEVYFHEIPKKQVMVLGTPEDLIAAEKLAK